MTEYLIYFKLLTRTIVKGKAASIFDNCFLSFAFDLHSPIAIYLMKSLHLQSGLPFFLLPLGSFHWATIHFINRTSSVLAK